jgi:hypothetical protein
MKNHSIPSRRLFVSLLALLFVVVGTFGLSSAAKSSAALKKNRYIGAEACKTCLALDAAGHEYQAWQEMKHASAFKTLQGEEAIKLGKERGVAEPWKSEKCLKCHVTGYGEPEGMFKKSFDPELGVQCETCHGPAELHKKARLRAAAEDDGEDEGFGDEDEDAVAEFVQIPEGELAATPTRDLCVTCHNDESPSYKHFCVYKFEHEVRHLDPRKPRTKEDLEHNDLVCKMGDDCDCTPETCDDVCPIPSKDLKK